MRLLSVREASEGRSFLLSVEAAPRSRSVHLSALPAPPGADFEQEWERQPEGSWFIALRPSDTIRLADALIEEALASRDGP